MVFVSLIKLTLLQLTHSPSLAIPQALEESGLFDNVEDAEEFEPLPLLEPVERVTRHLVFEDGYPSDEGEDEENVSMWLP